ncbi:hypothetical protein NL445_29660, partial [Klebsiella pneumoniae]|nr:hypothetical protein [Klebsiella pneumoniae]
VFFRRHNSTYSHRMAVVKTGKSADPRDVSCVFPGPDATNLVRLRRNCFQVPWFKRNDHQPPSNVF